jgi:transcriptional regulator with GAF, ATPase, and Fis domain
MSLARLVVIEGPDAGREFELPMRGGVVGRGEGSLVQLTDPTVSRQHGLIELRDGVLCWVDDSGKPRTLINGKPTALHPLAADDEILIGATKLVYLPVDGVAVTRASSHVTMEVGSRQLLALTGDPGDHRARRHLAALAQLGDRLRAEAAAGRDAVARAACDAALTALGAHRAFILSVSTTTRTHGRVTPVAAAIANAEATQLQAPADLVDKVVNGKQVVTAETGGRALIAAPVHGGADDVIGVLWIDRKGPPWDQIDTLAAGCLAHLTGAAWVGADARDQLVRRADALEEQLNGPLADADFIGRSAAAQRVVAFVTRVGPSDATVLLGGESGSGKEMVARAIHRASRRAKGPCVAVNCAALTESLIESELFGHEKGAFTGATEKKAGRFEMADHGTLFLDEVGELPLGLQTKFLRVLEERRFERVGGQKAIEVDVRMVAATNRDLAEMVKRGTFREDLYYRLSVINIEVPPLRERLDDVPLLADFFLARFRSQAARRISGFAPDALAAMTRYAWPGNVRELRNAVERAIVLGDREQIIADDLPPQVLSAAPLSRTRNSAPTPPLGSNSVALPMATPVVTPMVTPVATPVVTPMATIDPLPPPQIAAPKPPPARSLRDLEKQGILAALAATGGNKAQAAAILEIDRSTLYKKLKDYDIES